MPQLSVAVGAIPVIIFLQSLPTKPVWFVGHVIVGLVLSFITKVAADSLQGAMLVGVRLGAVPHP